MPLFSRKQSPEVILAKLQSAYELKQQGRFPEALSILNGILRQTPDNALALGYRGEIQGRLGHIKAALADLEQSVRLKPTAVVYFNYALAHLYAHNKSAALAALMRVTQLEPGDKEAQSLRERLAQELDLEELERVAQVAERFMYAECGPAIAWRVELRKMFCYVPDGSRNTYNAVVLDLCQEPLTLIQVQRLPPIYKVLVNIEKKLPGIFDSTLIDVITKVIPANNSALSEALHRLVEEEILVKSNGSLQYNAA